MGTRKWSKIKKLSKATEADRAEARSELEEEVRCAGGPKTVMQVLDQQDGLDLNGPTGATQPSSFFHSADVIGAQKTEALAMVGKTVLAVRYFSIDYERFEVAPDHVGFREISDAGERARRAWSYECGDTVDFGVEIETADRASYSIAWNPPGDIEGIGLYPLPMSQLLRSDACVAVWDVGISSRWTAILGMPVTEVELAYEPWSATGEDLWCPSVVLIIGGSSVRLMLGEVSSTGVITPSATNIVVSFSEHFLSI